MTYDQPRSLNELLAEKIAGTVLERIDYCFRYTTKDSDDACEAAGEIVRIYLEDLVKSYDIQKRVRYIVGGKYNGELFLDGFFNRK